MSSLGWTMSLSERFSWLLWWSLVPMTTARRTISRPPFCCRCQVLRLIYGLYSLKQVETIWLNVNIRWQRLMKFCFQLVLHILTLNHSTNHSTNHLIILWINHSNQGYSTSCQSNWLTALWLTLVSSVPSDVHQ